MNRNPVRSSIMLLVASMAVVACASQQSSGSGAASAIETYVKAVVAKNSEQVVDSSCADWEAQARLEIDSFEAAATSVDGLACETAGADGPYTLVRCQGKIVASYNGENQEFSLEQRIYQVVQDGGEWRMCGYK